MLPNLRLVLFFVCPIVETLKKYIRRLTMNSIVVYHTTIILNIVNKVANYMEFRVVKG